MKKDHRGVVWEIGEHSGAFALVFVAVFACTFVFLSAIGATPDPLQDISTIPVATQAVAAATTTPEEPVRVVAKDINLNVTVSNPTTTDITVLDNDLLSGAVRYPTSALLGVDGTVLIFGHSSYLPIVNDGAYKTFDGVQNLKPGDIVSVYSNDMQYNYSVTQVKVADATQDSIPLQSDGRYLTLVTCDSFATKSNRFVVTADFVGAYLIQQ